MKSFSKGQRVYVRTARTIIEGIVTIPSMTPCGATASVVGVRHAGWSSDQMYSSDQVYEASLESFGEIRRDIDDYLDSINCAIRVLGRKAEPCPTA